MHEYLLASIFAFTLGILGVELHVKNVITFDEQKKEWTEQDAGDKQVERFKESWQNPLFPSIDSESFWKQREREEITEKKACHKKTAEKEGIRNLCGQWKGWMGLAERAK